VFVLIEILGNEWMENAVFDRDVALGDRSPQLLDTQAFFDLECASKVIMQEFLIPKS
jgi:hypothetical protein